MSKVNNDVNPRSARIKVLLGNEISMVRKNDQTNEAGGGVGEGDDFSLCINRRKKSKQRNVNDFTTTCWPDVNHLTEGKLTIPECSSIGEKSIMLSFYWSL